MLIAPSYPEDTLYFTLQRDTKFVLEKKPKTKQNTFTGEKKAKISLIATPFSP